MNRHAAKRRGYSSLNSMQLAADALPFVGGRAQLIDVAQPVAAQRKRCQRPPTASVVPPMRLHWSPSMATEEKIRLPPKCSERQHISRGDIVGCGGPADPGDRMGCGDSLGSSNPTGCGDKNGLWRSHGMRHSHGLQRNSGLWRCQGRGQYHLCVRLACHGGVEMCNM